MFRDTALISRDELNLGTIPGSTTVATIGYSDLHYQGVQLVDPLGELSREQLIAHALEERKVGQVLYIPEAMITVPILTRKRAFRLLPSSCRSDDRMCWQGVSAVRSH